MPKFKTKPVEKEAILFTGKNTEEIMAFMGASEGTQDFVSSEILIQTLEGTMKASPGDWIIKGLRGEFYPCKPDIFEKTYEPVPEKPNLPEYCKRVTFHSRELLLIGDYRKSPGAPLATQEQYENFEPSFAHVNPDGAIVRMGQQIGTIENLKEVE